MMNNTAMQQQLILVDRHDRIIGYADNGCCHRGSGILHRAVSVFIFNGRGDVLVQRRSIEKRLWPLYWSTSCCGHPVRGESYREAAVRRVREELGLVVEPKLAFVFSYYAPFGEAYSEREICSVFHAVSDTTPCTDQRQVSDWLFMSPQALSADLSKQQERYTPWLFLEWRRLKLQLDVAGEEGQQHG